MKKDRRDISSLQAAREITIFGSYAARLNRSDSDIDVLCIGNGLRMKSRALDMLWITEHELAGSDWLGSELAGHVAKHGVWIRGDGDWRGHVFSAERAIERKRRRIVSVSRAAAHFWTHLHPTFQHQYDVSIRRELQRLFILINHGQVPPSKVLDDEWDPSARVRILGLRNTFPELQSYRELLNVPPILKLCA